MTLDLPERFQVFREAAKRLAAAIKSGTPKDIAEEARYTKALLTQIEHAAEMLEERKGGNRA